MPTPVPARAPYDGPAASWLRYLPWGIVGLAGAVWALGLVRTWAFAAYCAACYTAGTALAAALIGAAAAVLVARYLTSRGHGANVIALGFSPLFLPAVALGQSTYRPWQGGVLLLGSLAVVVLTLLRASRRLWFGLAVVVPLLVYLPDISPYVGRADTFEFQVVGPTLGIAHPSGYPLYVLVAKAFSLLPFGSPAWRVNLSSAVFAALATGWLFLTLSTLPDTARPRAMLPVSFVAAQILAFSPTLWSRAIEAEVYALNACLLALALWIAVRWRAGRLPTARAWPLLGLLVGVGMASHVTLGALGLLALALFAASHPKPRLRTWMWALLGGIAGLLLYAYIPLRWPAVTGGETMSLAHFLRFVTNAESGGALHPLAFVQDPARWLLVGRLVHAQVGWAGLALAVIGLVRLLRSHPALGWGTLLSFAAWTWFNLSFYVADPDYSAFLIPAHVMLIFWLGWGARGLGGVLLRRYPRWLPLGLALLALLPLSRIWQTGPELDTISQGRADELWARYALAQPLDEGAAILADSEKFPPLYYLQQVNGVRPDLELVTLFSEAQYRADLETRLAAGQSVYLARYLPGMDLYGVSSVGPLVAVAPDMGALPQAAGVGFGNALELVDHTLTADPFERRMHHLDLTWRVDAPIAEDLEVRFRLVHPSAGTVVWEASMGRPVSGYTTTQSWQSGHRVRDYHALVWPDWLTVGVYTLEVGMFPRFEARGLPVMDQDDAWYVLDTVELSRPAEAALPSRLSILLGRGLWLVGAREPGEVAAGAPVYLDLAWGCSSAPASLEDLRVRWIGQDSSDVIEQNLPRPIGAESAVCGSLTPRSSTAEVQRYELRAPDVAGRYRLEIGHAGEQMARCRWLGPRQSACSVGWVNVGPEVDGLANYDGRILLLDADVDAEEVPAGGPLSVVLRWRALEALDEDYTVFVQVIGPDDRLYGQVDTWPVQGARPTRGWRVGEEVVDTHSFYVDGEGPVGTYQVIVGWYLLADMGRLPVIDASGRPIGDFFEIDRFTLP